MAKGKLSRMCVYTCSYKYCSAIVLGFEEWHKNNFKGKDQYSLIHVHLERNSSL